MIQFSDDEWLRLLNDSDDMTEIRRELDRVSGGSLSVDWVTDDDELAEMDIVRVGYQEHSEEGGDRWVETEAVGVLMWAMRQPEYTGADLDDLLDSLWESLEPPA